jgi:N-acetylglucosaminyldiphosphoundecaprenol N-acetyl-beta-D-mannosaminyltransferase
MTSQRIRILGVSIDNVTMDEAVALIMTAATASWPRHVVTVNPEYVMAARRLPEFAAVLDAADLAVPDGVGLMWAARWRRTPLRQRVAGVDLVERVAAAAAERGLGVFFLGAAPGVAEQASAVLSRRYPGLRVSGAFAGSPGRAGDPDIIGRVSGSGARILFVAFGAPLQDLWIARNQPRLPVGVAMGVGGAFDFISGRVPRAPAWLRRVGLEWLYRLIRQPWRWRRMLALPRFAWAVIRER